MRLTLLRRSLLFLCLLAIASCNASPPTRTEVEPVSKPTAEQAETAPDESKQASEVQGDQDLAADKQTAETKDRPKPIAPAIAPGEYCYQLSDDIQDIDARIIVDASDKVTGNVQGVVHNEANGYYTSYQQKLDGTIDGSNLNLDITTWIELDRQNRQETWKVMPQSLSTRRDTLSLESCETVNAAFQVDGLEAKDLTEGANQVRQMEVFFDAGKSSTTVSNVVVRGDRDVYTLTAQAAQQMTLSISAVEDNAVFDVISPSGMILVREDTEETLYLPELGEYQIIVGGTRGNATYDLAIAIQ